MSESSDTKKQPSKSQHKELAIKLGAIQRRAKDLKIPALVVIEGIDASHKGKLLTQMILEIDSRAYKIHSTHTEDQLPKKYPLLWQFWNNTPARGMIQFFDRSAYYLIQDAYAEGRIKKSEMARYLDDVKKFERQLSDDGVEIIKVYLQISKKEQAKRLEKLEDNPKTKWRVTQKDWKRHRNYKSNLETINSMIEKTDHSFAPWKIIDSTDLKTASAELYETVIEKLEAAVEKAEQQSTVAKPPREWLSYTGKDYLAEVKPREPMERSAYKKELKELQAIVYDLSHEIHYHKIPVVMVFCGWDAAGKGGCIKRLLHGMDPRGYDVIPVAAPTPVELSHHYMWRFWKEYPHNGKITIFDRSWYGRVLVERVEALCENKEWQRAYQEINETEQHLAVSGVTILKFWLHIDKDTQLERFEARVDNPHKSWKITDEDWRNRNKWDKYVESVNQMIDETSNDHSNWHIVDANCKMNARIETLKITIKTLRQSIDNFRKPPVF